MARWRGPSGDAPSSPSSACRAHGRDRGPERITIDGAARILQFREDEVFAWRWDEAEGYPSRTSEIEVEARDRGTVVRVTDTPTDREAPHGEVIPLAVAAGWGEALTLMKMWVEHGVRYGCVLDARPEFPRSTNIRMAPASEVGPWHKSCAN